MSLVNPGSTSLSPPDTQPLTSPPLAHPFTFPPLSCSWPCDALTERSWIISTIGLIGIHRAWQSEQLPREFAQRFAASLGLAGKRPASLYRDHGGWFAATAVSAGWQPQRLPNGDRVLFSGHIGNRAELRRRLKPEQLLELNALLVPFGKYTCTESQPHCSKCPLASICKRVGVSSSR